MKKPALYVFLFCFGAAGYAGLEVFWRGYTHWTMALCGGVCLILLYRLDRRMAGLDTLKKSAAGCAAITAVEFAAGCVVNLGFGLEVWSYAGVPGNLLGQICLPFMLVWFMLALAVFAVMAGARKLRRRQIGPRWYKLPGGGETNDTILQEALTNGNESL